MTAVIGGVVKPNDKKLQALLLLEAWQPKVRKIVRKKENNTSFDSFLQYWLLPWIQAGVSHEGFKISSVVTWIQKQKKQKKNN